MPLGTSTCACVFRSVPQCHLVPAHVHVVCVVGIALLQIRYELI